MIVEPVGSILNGGEPHAHKTEGIGMEFIPDYMDKSHFDEIYTVTDENAFRLVKEAAEKEGLADRKLFRCGALCGIGGSEKSIRWN